MLSTSMISSLLACAGAILLVAAEPIVRMVHQPRFDMSMAVFCGVVLMVLGAGVRRLLFDNPLRRGLPF